MFSHDLEGKFALTALDMSEGTLQLKPQSLILTGFAPEYAPL
jgi:hypothetical protein